MFAAHDYLRLKAAFRRLVKLAGGQESSASVTRVDFQRIGRYGRAHEMIFAPIDVVADLEADTARPEVTRILADMAGFVLIAKPPASGNAAWIAQLGALAKEAGEALARLGEAFGADGDISAEEILSMDLRREVREVIEAATAIDVALADVLRRFEFSGAADLNVRPGPSS